MTIFTVKHSYCEVIYTIEAIANVIEYLVNNSEWGKTSID